MFLRQRIAWFLVVCLLLVVVVGCNRQAADQGEFGLENPPEDWHQFVDPVDHYAIWVPDSWQEEVVQNAPDITVPTSYASADGSTRVAVYALWDIDSDQEPYNVLWQTLRGVAPSAITTFTLHVNNTSIPCARWTHATRSAKSYPVYRRCIVGPYRGVYWRIGLHTESRWEAEVEPTWRWMVTSFVLEQSSEGD